MPLDDILDMLAADTEFLLVTRGREDQISLNQLPEKIRQLFTIVTTEDNLGLLGDIRLPIRIVEHENVCELYSKLYRECKKPYVLILQDNIDFITKELTDLPVKKELKFKPMDTNHFSRRKLELLFTDMFMSILTPLYTGAGMSGLVNKAFNICDEKVTPNQKVFACYAVNPVLFETCEKSDLLHNGRYTLFDDNITQLAFIESGVPTYGIRNFCFMKHNGANSEGGISEYRTQDLQQQELIQQQEDFGEKYIKLKIAPKKSSYNYACDDVMYSTIYYKKLWKDNQHKRGINV